jgi:hypothetical protein
VRELRQFRSCDGKVTGTQREVALHEVRHALPQRLLSRLRVMWQRHHDGLAPSLEEDAVLQQLCTAIIANRHHVRQIRDVLQQVSDASCFLPLEEDSHV